MAAARGLRECRSVQEGVDAETAVAVRRAHTAPRGAWECPYNAYEPLVEADALATTL